MDIGDMRAGRAFKVLLRLAMAAAGAALLAGCEEDLGVTSNARAFAPIPKETLASFAAKGTSQNAPVLIRAYKAASESFDGLPDSCRLVVRGDKDSEGGGRLRAPIVCKGWYPR